LLQAKNPPNLSLHNLVSKNLYDKKPVNLGRHEKRSASQQVLAGFCLYSSDPGLWAPIHPSEVDEPDSRGFYTVTTPKSFFLETIRIRFTVQFIAKMVPRWLNQIHYPVYSKNGSEVAESDATERMHSQALPHRLKGLVYYVYHYHWS
jgi:hypothetical protein